MNKLEWRLKKLEEFIQEEKLDYTLHVSQCRLCHHLQIPPRLCSVGKNLKRKLEELEKERSDLLQEISRTHPEE